MPYSKIIQTSTQHMIIINYKRSHSPSDPSIHPEVFLRVIRLADGDVYLIVTVKMWAQW